MKFILSLLYLALTLLVFGSVASAQSPLQQLLCNAALTGDTTEVKSLLTKGAEINVRNTDGETPLYVAAYAGKKNIVLLLLSKGADVKMKNSDEETPLHGAAYSGKKDIADLLLSKGAEINAKGKNGTTALYRAASSGNKAVAEFLLLKGADVNAKNENGDSPLHRSAVHGNKEIIELLIANGAAINAKNSEGETPLHEAVSYGKPDIVELLLVKGADVNARGKNGGTPLHRAAANGSMKIVELLLTHGADVNARLTSGVPNKPRDVALIFRFTNIVELLDAFAVNQTIPTPSSTNVPTPIPIPTQEIGFTELIAQLKLSPDDQGLREKIIKRALEITPVPVVPAEAERLEGRAQYAFKNAKSEADMVDAAREYLKALEAAPWLANYYFNLGTILEKANRPAEAIVAFTYYLLAAPEATDGNEVRKQLAGLEYAIERQSENFTRRYSTIDMNEIYKVGVKWAQIGASSISVKLISSLYGGVWRNQLMIADITLFPGNIAVQRFELDPIDKTFQLEDRVSGTPWFRLTIAQDGRITFGASGSTQAEIVTSTSELLQYRVKQLSNSIILIKSDKFYVELGQGGTLAANDGARMNGNLYFESDCKGNLIGEKPGWFPTLIVPHPQTPGVTSQQSSPAALGFRLASLNDCMSVTNDALGWLSH